MPRWLLIVALALVIADVSGLLSFATITAECVAGCADDDEAGRCTPGCEDCACCSHVRVMIAGSTGDVGPVLGSGCRLEEVRSRVPAVDPPAIAHVPISLLV